MNMRCEHRAAVLALTIACCAASVTLGLRSLPPLTPAMHAELAEIRSNITESTYPEILRNSARRLGAIKADECIDLLSLILDKCDEFERTVSSNAGRDDAMQGRAYAMYALIQLAEYSPRVHSVIADHFVIDRGIGQAMLVAHYPDLFSLLERQLQVLFDKYPGTASDEESAADLVSQFPAVRFTLASHPEDARQLVSAEFYRQMLDCAEILEHSRASDALPVCLKLLQHGAAYLWEKQTYRAILNLALPPHRRYDALRDQLQHVRNREHDDCTWDLTRPGSLFFSINAISAEAYLVIAIWYAPGIPFEQKTALIAPSLDSSSFTARAAATDVLASSPASTKTLAKLLQSTDPSTKRFLAVRLAGETNAYARVLISHLAQHPQSQ